MRSRDYRPFLEDIHDCCERILRYKSGFSEEEFFADEKTYDAVIRNLIVIGEAVKQIPPDVREQYLAIDWKKIGRFRDYVIHEYFSINNEIIWDVIENKVPQLLADLNNQPVE